MMRLSVSDLPEGRSGQVIASGLTIAVLAFVALVIVMPIVHWYQGRENRLAGKREMAAHILATQRMLPSLQQRFVQLQSTASAGQILLPGSSDAIAGANLQSALQGLASQAGTSLSSAAMQPAKQVGVLRRIGVEINVTATWSALTALLASIDAARPRMIVEDLSISTLQQTDIHADAPLQATFSVAAFRAGRTP